MHTRLIPFVRAAATVAVVAGTMFASAASAQVCPYNSTQGTCACPTSGAGTTCFGGQLYRASDNSCQNDGRPCAANQNWSCATTSCVCNTAAYPCGGCTAATSAPGGQSCSGFGGCPTDGGAPGLGGIYTNVCSGVGCPVGTTLCPGSPGSCVENRTCPAGTTWDVCSDTCTTPNVLLSPGWIQNGFIQINGDLKTTAGNLRLDAATGVGQGDVYIANGKAIRVDGSGVTALYIGNWGVGGTAVDISLTGGLSASGALSVGGNTALGNAVGDTLTVSAGTWNVPNAVTVNLNGGNMNYRAFGTDFFSLYRATAAVGVGITTPDAKLSVSQGATSGDAMRVRMNNTLNPGVAMNVNNGGTGPSLVINDDGTYTDASPFVVDANGNVGIGTSSPADGLLEIVRPSTSNRGNIVFGTGANNDWELGQIYSDGRFAFKAVTSQPIVGPMIMLLDPAGRVGINTETPAEALDVFGKVKALSLQVTTGAGAGRYLVSDASGNATWSTAALIGGSGTTNYLPKFTAASTVGNSQLFDNGTNVGVGTASPSAKLTVNGGSVLFTGATGATPVSGAGTRLMWIPAKSAFRAGTVSSTQWDDVSVGTNSFASGTDTTASGAASFAAGIGSTASGTGAVAIGEYVGANANYAVALGRGNAGGVGATAAGYASSANGAYSTAFGYAANASGDVSFAAGQAPIASGYSSVALGQYNNASASYSATYGNFLTSSAYKSITIGNGIDGVNKLVNNLGYSIMFGAHSTLPTMTIYNAAPGVGTIGKVGIGTSSPDSRLHVMKGDAGTVTAHPEASLALENSTHNYLNILAPDASETGILFGKPSNNISGGIVYNNVAEVDGFQFRTGGNSTKLTLTSTGNVGIGTATLDPATPLSVSGNGVNVYATDAWIENNMHVQGNEALVQGGRARMRVGTAWGYPGLYTDNSSTGAATDLVLGAGSGQVRIGPDGGGQNLLVSGVAGIGGWAPSTSYGVRAEGSVIGGRFTNESYNGSAYVGYYDAGIYASGSSYGGYFYDTDNGNTAYVAYAGYSFNGSGVLNNTGDVRLNGKHAFRGSDSWLRLNQDGGFSSGVYTPGTFRTDGNVYFYGTIQTNWVNGPWWAAVTNSTYNNNTGNSTSDTLCAVTKLDTTTSRHICNVYASGGTWWWYAYASGGSVTCDFWCAKIK